MIKYFGTHNSGTSSKLVWWQRPFAYLLHLTSRCQTLSIKEQCENNVKLFNLQVTYYKGGWYFSHGLCLYTLSLEEALRIMEDYATPQEPIYYQLYLDKNFFLGQNIEEFKKLVNLLLSRNNDVKMRCAWIEGTEDYIYRDNIKLNTSEHYWTASWAGVNASSWLDKLPLPKRHAKKFNKKYVEENKADYLMLDFIEIK